ncbi:hypothetical protein GW17_00062406 [Ensete ventricosum]|nr:hypothetical protein GW17_00062406 [Ensete ventricosum]
MSPTSIGPPSPFESSSSFWRSLCCSWWRSCPSAWLVVSRIGAAAAGARTGGALGALGFSMAEGLRPLEFSVLRALMPNPLQQQCSQAGWGGQVTWAELNIVAPGISYLSVDSHIHMFRC